MPKTRRGKTKRHIHPLPYASCEIFSSAIDFTCWIEFGDRAALEATAAMLLHLCRFHPKWRELAVIVIKVKGESSYQFMREEAAVLTVDDLLEARHPEDI